MLVSVGDCRGEEGLLVMTYLWQSASLSLCFTSLSDTGSLCIQGAVLYLLRGGSSSWTAHLLYPPCDRCFMPPLTAFPLPLVDVPPAYARPERALSDLSTTTGFITRLNRRDQFLGEIRCIVCGRNEGVEYCHLIPKADRKTVSRISYLSKVN
jgi:hypothetical protein